MTAFKNTFFLMAILFGFSFSQQNEKLKLMVGLLNPDEDVQLASAKAMVQSGDLEYAAAMIDVLYFKKLSADSRDELERLTHKKIGNNWPKWMEWLGQQPIENSVDYKNFKRFLFSKIDPQFSSFLNPRFPSYIRWDEIVWGGAVKDGIPSLDNPLMIKSDAADYIEGDEPVLAWQ